jgi:hypothetical protein
MLDLHLPEVIDLSPKNVPNDFYQRRVWYQRDGTPIFTWDMSLDHLNNTLALLRRNATRIHNRESWAMCYWGAGSLGPHGDMAMDAFDREFTDMLEADPWEWLKSTPLVKAMRKARKARLKGRSPRRYCEHSWTGKDFCPQCSDQLIDEMRRP